MSNKLIEKILDNKELSEYLDDGDWINFWEKIKDIYEINLDFNITLNDFKEFSELIPESLKVLKILKRKNDSLYKVRMKKPDHIQTIFLKDIESDLKTKITKGDDAAFFSSPDDCVKYAKKKFGINGIEDIYIIRVVTKHICSIYLNVSKDIELPIYNYCFEIFYKG